MPHPENVPGYVCRIHGQLPEAEAYEVDSTGLSEKEKAKLIKEYTAEMKDAAKNLQFERAAELRDMIKKLEE